MRANAIMKIVAGIAVCMGAQLASADTIIYLKSEDHDFVGQGLTQQLNFASQEIQAQVEPGGDVQVFGFSNDRNFSMRLGSPRGWDRTLLTNATCYERAQHAALRENGRPGLHFSLDSRGCSESMSRFRVREITTTGNQVESLSVDFVQHCQRAGGAALFGNVRINSTDDRPQSFEAPVFNSSGTLTFVATLGGVGSSAPGGVASIAMPSTLAIADGSAYNGALFRYNGPLPGQMGDRSWRLQFDAPDLGYLGAGDYPNATRFGFQAMGEAGLEFTYDGAGVNTISGNFMISSARYDALDGFPTVFNAVFVQNREGNPASRTNGAIVYEALFRNGAVIFSGGFEDSETGLAAVDLVYPCAN